MVPAFVARQPRTAARLLVVPGLNDSGPAHWQSWLQSLHRHSVRVVQRDWSTPDLDRWAARIGSTLERAGPGPWIAAAHSFGCLAVARHLALRPDSPISAALLVAPADPDKFGVAGLLPAQALPVHSTMVTSDTDPWMTASNARRWAQRWGSHTVNLGDAGHINSEAGFGPLPFARRWITAMAQRLERSQRASRASLAEWSFAI
ncbi:alpha/beta hydrolase [Aquincola sp. MAHUQ-54]|uniref:Alpha/beta hydrolase n=1 Tax=Aquincola agrisoli TaxID=3119538 RepID=A0AAW9QNV1_9BURK